MREDEDDPGLYDDELPDLDDEDGELYPDGDFDGDDDFYDDEDEYGDYDFDFSGGYDNAEAFL
jgi:hypothetical protein